MKTSILITAAFIIATITTSAFAQVPPPGPKPRPHPQQLQKMTVAKGTLKKYTTNDDFIVDGFVLTTSDSDSLHVKFPPHLGKKVVSQTSKNSTVSVTGIQNVSPTGEKEFRMQEITAGNTTISDAPPAGRPAPPQEKYVSISGKITSFKRDPQNNINGFFLNNNTIVNLPPNMGQQVSGLVGKGGTIKVKGSQRTLNDGEYQLKHYKIVRADILGINGDQYKVH